jgi:hypothetical protein
VKYPGCEKAAQLKTVEYQGCVPFLLPKPFSKTANIIGPGLKRHFLKGSRALSHAAVIKSEHFHSVRRQMARPLNPRSVRRVPDRGKRTNEENACNRVLNLVQDCVQMGAGNREISGILGTGIGRISVGLC